MRLCGSDLAAGGICFTPLNLSTGECRTADAHVIEPLTLVAPLAEESDEAAPTLSHRHGSDGVFQLAQA